MQVLKNTQMPIAQQPTQIKAPMSWAMRLFLLFVLMVIGVCVSIATVVAKTGLFEVPLISKVVSSVSEPSRTVVIPPATPTVQETAATQVQGAIARYARSREESDRAFQLRVSEASITKSLLAELPNMKEKFEGADVQYAQLAIEPEAMEFYVKLKRNGRENTLSGKFTVTILETKPMVVIQEVRLGTVRIPGFMLNGIMKLFARQNIDDVTATISQIATLNDAELRRGLAIISGKLATGVVNGR